MSDDKPTFEIEAECKQETDDAILCVLETGDEKWIPKSVVHEDSEVFEKDGEGTLIIYEWWAEREGLT